MIRNDYWHIKPHTERKLDILDKYLNAWIDIILSTYKKHSWSPWQTPFYIDCFSGRGKYHKGMQNNCIDGSPIIAIKKLIEKKISFEEKYNIKIFPKCRLIEYDKTYAIELDNFIKPYKDQLDIQIITNDFNVVIGNIILETGFSPSFFFVDAGGIKELKQTSVEKIVTKKGARDILLNYVVDGQIRIGGLAQSVSDGTYKGNKIKSVFKTIMRLEDFTGMEINKFLEETGNDYKEALQNYVKNVIHANNKVQNEKDRLQTIVYDMKDLDRQKLVYYLIFSSRKSVATKIMKNIFNGIRKSENIQGSLFDPEFIEVK